MQSMHNFSAASALDTIVHGSSRPGIGRVQTIPKESVDEWISFMKSKDIQRVVVLLHDDQLKYYQNDLLQTYRPHFSEVTWAPIRDFDLPDPSVLERALQALANAEQAGEKVVVHCSAGMGRTGFLLAGWLVVRHGLSSSEAARTVVEFAQQQGAVRVPSEADGALKLLEGLQSK